MALRLRWLLRRLLLLLQRLLASRLFFGCGLLRRRDARALGFDCSRLLSRWALEFDVNRPRELVSPPAVASVEHQLTRFLIDLVVETSALHVMNRETGLFVSHVHFEPRLLTPPRADRPRLVTHHRIASRLKRPSDGDTHLRWGTAIRRNLAMWLRCSDARSRAARERERKDEKSKKAHARTLPV